MGNLDPSAVQKNIDQLNGMDDSQMENMVNMMKSNPGMMKANYEM